ncbi:MAG: hypothetical protein KF832_15190 [Caldilineaceae bacterium]|nr:hypothetical protein [Caldilineaceae bacterium]
MALWATPLAAHGGGTPRLTSELAGPYRVFAWTQPEPLRVGEFHLSIAVVKAAAVVNKAGEALDEAVTDATVAVHLMPLASDAEPFTVLASLQAQLGNYYYEVDTTLPTQGEWRFTIEVDGALGVGQTAFAGSVLAARAIDWWLVGVAGVALLCLLSLIGLWNRLQAKEKVP